MYRFIVRSLKAIYFNEINVRPSSSVMLFTSHAENFRTQFLPQFFKYPLLLTHVISLGIMSLFLQEISEAMGYRRLP